MSARILFFFLSSVTSFLAVSQDQIINGFVSDTNGSPISDVSILLRGTQRGTTSGEDGRFSIGPYNPGDTLLFSHVQFESRILVMDTSYVEVTLRPETKSLQDVIIKGSSDADITNRIEINAEAVRSLPSAFGDFNKILITLPGVASNNELSSAYSVRGGNFDENLVYVNDIPVYRPFLANAGRQEGLSFVNPDLVDDIDFYPGGWEPKYGDKLSSSLNIQYKEPFEQEGALSAGLLGGTAYLGGTMNNGSYLIGARHQDSRYLLNSLETSGEYFPTYTDIQSLLTFNLSNKRTAYSSRSKINLLIAYSRNRYLTKPTSQLTDFGTVRENFRIETAFQGREQMNYDTFQSGLHFSHYLSDRLRMQIITSGMVTKERELFEVEGAYRLSDLESQLTGPDGQRNIQLRGIGSNYDYGRNSLSAQLYTLENRWEFLAGPNLLLEGGIGTNLQGVRDELNEYSFIDSADFVSVTYASFNEVNINSEQFFGYLQGTIYGKDSISSLILGGRVNYWTLNRELLISPRATYRFTPKWETPTSFTISAGLYQQPPFYRELRDYEGEINTNRKAQKSMHLIAGMQQGLTMWGRPFIFTSDVYYKYLYDIIPYDIDNVRIRFLSENNAKAYATGIDLRLNGEFIKGTQSWFSISYLQTKEDLEGDENGYIRRPTDQRINLAVYFEDHMPVDPTIRVYLNLVFGSGYPFGPPRATTLRNAFQGDEYYRADLGLSKVFNLRSNHYISKFWVRAEILNALGADNTLSYTWIEDVNGNNFAIPNSLSARFLNIKFIVEL